MSPACPRTLASGGLHGIEAALDFVGGDALDVAMIGRLRHLVGRCLVRCFGEGRTDSMLVGSFVPT
jgi:hypothetical protein